ncbi:glycosyltransferase [Sphingomonas glacialis]|uniref:Glycosyltransferase n=1 Tax=Sphingomonas glacialis TaxID=658225 RepID=A0A502FXX4_9SPHN|nr:glycosyltransferase [Sphingomonas glacialis]TPG54487.1 glycosyltransferase [Sphingomonas glacialis]
MGTAFIAARQIDGVEPPLIPVSLAPIQSPPAPRPLRILTYLYSFAPGGVERVAARLHAAWSGAGVDTQIVLADASVAPPQPVRAMRQVGPRARKSRFAGFVALARGLPAVIDADRPDALFCAGNTYTALAVVLRLMLGRACPPIVAKISNCLVRPDMPPLLGLFYKIWLRIQGRYIDHFVAMAPAMRAEIAQRTGVTRDRISVIPDPALSAGDLVRLASARDAVVRDRPGRHYLAVGRLAPQKNFSLLLQAFAQAAVEGDTLTILGDGVERAMLEQRAATLGIAHAVRLPGHTDPLDNWLAQADVFVLSSIYEGVPAVVIEALAAGLPIVATDCCVAMPDLLGHGALGTIVPNGDCAALARAMTTIALDDAVVVAARRASAAAFTVEHAAGAYLDVIRALASARQASARDAIAVRALAAP